MILLSKNRRFLIKKNKNFKVLAMVMVFTTMLCSMFSTNVLANERTQMSVSVEPNTTINERSIPSNAYVTPQHEFEKVYTFTESAFGVTHTMKVYVTWTLEYYYVEGSYSQITYANIDVTKVTIDGTQYSFLNTDYEVHNSWAGRIIRVNNSKNVEIFFSVDEWGDVVNEAYIVSYSTY